MEPNFVNGNLVLGAVLLILGFLMYKFPPKIINSFYGYKTPQSMSDQKKWDFAQVYSSKFMMILGLVFMLIAPVGLVIKFEESITTIVSIGLLLLGSGLMIYKTETEMKKIKL